MSRTAAPTKSRPNDPVKEAAIAALKRAIDPLVGVMFNASLTVRELSQLVRERAVLTAAKRVAKQSGRDNKARVAIMTGLPRSEVARILDSDEVSRSKRSGQPSATRRILTAWFDDPRFQAPNGHPAVLPIFGRRRSFEHLVAMHTRGIPLRAMLDELMELDAVQRLPDQRVKALSRLPVSKGMTGSAIAAVGERTRDLLETLNHNLRHTSKPLFERTALVDKADPEMVSLVRREIAEQGANFIDSANSLLSRSCAKPSRSMAKTTGKCRLGVTVYYFQDDVEGAIESTTERTHGRRKNLQRQRHPTKSKRAGVTDHAVAKG
jgi:Family of unknown function (DUF6502)